MIFLTSGWIKSTKELKLRIRGYFKRWGVEECYRFEKQGVGIEKSTARKYSRIKALLGLSLMSWLVLIKINEDGRLREAVFNIRIKRGKRKKLLKKIQNELPPLLKEMNTPEEWLPDWFLEAA